MNTAQKLYRLQRIEQEIESGEQSLASLKGRLGDSPALISARGKVSSALAHLDALKKEQKSLEWEVDDIRGKLVVVSESLYSGRVRNPKELSDIQKEEKTLEMRRNQLEDRVLEIMEQTESASARIAEARAELAAVEKEWKSRQRELLGQIEKTTRDLAALAEKQRMPGPRSRVKWPSYITSLKKEKAGR